jgi:hypothetical protein
MTQTKAEQLADRLVQTSSLGTILICNSAAEELRRLSQIEAELAAMKAQPKIKVWDADGYDTLCQEHEVGISKLLEVNKVLVDSSKALLNSYTFLVYSGVSGHWDPEDDDEVIALRSALKLAGELE